MNFAPSTPKPQDCASERSSDGGAGSPPPPITPVSTAKPRHKENRLNKETVLQLLPDLSIHRGDDGRIILKNPHQRTYMVLNRNMARVLNMFQNPTSLERALAELIRTHTCPPLSEFFDLIELARRKHMFVSSEPTPEPIRAYPWPLALPPAVASAFAYVCILFGATSWALHAKLAPESLLDFLVAGVLMTLSLSLGQVLSAGIARHYSCEVHSPYFHWRTLFPHFRVEQEDIQIAGRAAEYRAALVQIAPVFLALGLATLLLPSAAGLVMLGVLNALAPTGKSPARRLLRARFLPKQFDLSHHQPSESTSSARHRIRQLRARFSWKLFLIELPVNSAWILAFGMVAWSVFSELETRVLRDGSQNLSLYATLGLCAAVLGMITVRTLAWWRKRADRRAQLSSATDAANARWHEDQLHYERLSTCAEAEQALPLEELGKLRLFQDVPPDALERLSHMMECAQIGAGDYIFQEETNPTHVLIICGGRVSLQRDVGKQRRAHTLTLGAGSIIDLSSVLHGNRGSITVRAVDETYALVVPLQLFKSKFIPLLGEGVLREYMLEYNFLRRFRNLEHWTDAAIDVLAASGKMEFFESEEVILAENTEALRLFLVLEGKVRGERKGGKRTTYQPGEFFGERGLLDHSLTQEKRVAMTPVVCLTLPTSAFIRLLSVAPSIALEFERSAEKALGRPLFASSLE